MSDQIETPIGCKAYHQKQLSKLSGLHRKIKKNIKDLADLPEDTDTLLINLKYRQH